MSDIKLLLENIDKMSAISEQDRHVEPYVGSKTPAITDKPPSLQGEPLGSPSSKDSRGLGKNWRKKWYALMTGLGLLGLDKSEQPTGGKPGQGGEQGVKANRASAELWNEPPSTTSTPTASTDKTTSEPDSKLILQYVNQHTPKDEKQQDVKPSEIVPNVRLPQVNRTEPIISTTVSKPDVDTEKQRAETQAKAEQEKAEAEQKRQADAARSAGVGQPTTAPSGTQGGRAPIGTGPGSGAPASQDDPDGYNVRWMRSQGWPKESKNSKSIDKLLSEYKTFLNK